MDMMEKYGRNLEENVEERAQQLLEEKRKTDRLLYRLLPAWVNSDVTRPLGPKLKWFYCSSNCSPPPFDNEDKNKIETSYSHNKKLKQSTT